MSNIDENVVRMEFDNSRFEKNIKTTQNSLDKLKNKLNFSSATDGMTQLQRASNRFSMSNLTNAVNMVANRFSNMGIVGMTVIQNLTNTAVNAARRMIRALSVDQISAGFKEYELKMGSIQTIMASTGESLQTVNQYLQELNTYSDKTIYSFSDMTRNIGKFTNAGVKLEDAVSAIKGISNEAAVSGANAEEASRAMYNFAQALSAGSVKLIDWKSIENANMATIEFKKQLLETATALGTVEKTEEGYVSTTKNLNGKVSQAFTTTKGFNESLSHQWMTTDVLVQTLAKYADETTDIGKKAYAAAQDIKTFTQLMDTLKEAVGSGWAETWQLVFGDLNQAKELWTSISVSVGDFIGRVAEVRNTFLTKSLASSWRQFMGNGIDDVSSFEEEVANVARSNDIAIDDMIEKHGSFEKTLRTNWLTADILSESMSRYQAKIHNMSAAEREAAGITEELVDHYDAMSRAIKRGDISVDEFVADFSKLSGRENVIEGFKNSFKSLGTYLLPIKEAFNEIFNISLDDWASSFYESTEKFKSVTSIFKIGEENAKNLKETFKGLFSIIDMGKKVLSSAFSGLKNFGGIFDTIVSTLLKATAAIGKFFTGLNESAEKTNYIGNTIHKAFGWLGDISSEFGENLLSGLSAVFSKIGDFFTTFGKGIWESLTNVFTNFDLNEVFGALTAGGAAAISLNLGRLLDLIKKIPEALSGHEGILDRLGETISDFQARVKVGNLTAIATAIGVLAVSFTMLSGIDTGKISSSMFAFVGIITTVFTGMSVLAKKVSTLKIGPFVKVAHSLTGIAVSMLILATALRVLSSLNIVQVAIGLGAIAASMTIFVVALNKMSKIDGKVAKVAATLSGMAASMLILSGAIAILGNMSFGEVALGVGAIASLMLILDVFLKSMKKNDIASATTGIIGMAAAMVIMAGAIAIMGNLGIEKLVTGLLGLVGALGAMTIFMGMMDGSLSSAGSFLIMAAGITVLTVSLMALSAMDPKGLAIAVITLGGALAVLGVASALLAPVAPAMLAVSGAVALLGVGVFAAGAGLMALGAGVTALAGALLAGAGGIVGGLTTIVVGLVTILPVAATALAAAVVAFVVTLANGAKDIAVAFVKIVTEVVAQLGAAAPQLVTAGMQLVLALIAGVAAAMPAMVSGAVALVISFINGVANAIRNNADPIMDAVGNLLSSIIEFVLTALQHIVSLIPGIGDDMAEGLESAKEAVRDALTSEDATSLGADAADNYASGMTSKDSDVSDAGTEVGNSGTEGIATTFEDYMSSGGFAVDGFIEGLYSKVGEANDAGATVGSAALAGLNGSLDVNSPSKKMMASGAFGGEGFIIGISSYIRKSNKAGASLGNSLLDGVNTAMTYVDDIMKADNGYHPVISPVIDLSSAKKGASRIQALLSQEQASTLNTKFQATGTDGASKSDIQGSTTFIQNNYSPKALSRTEIYRQTRNQVVAARKV